MNRFKSNIINIYGNRGEEWLAEIPKIIASLAKKYHLTQLKPFSNMSYNYIATGYQQDKPIVLKLGLDCEALTKESYCIKSFANHGAVEWIASEEGALIMQRLEPGSSLKKYFPDREEESIEITASIIKKLHSASIPTNYHFSSADELLQGLDNCLHIDNRLAIKAQRLRDKLLATTQKLVLLHGDLHHDNILQNGDEWLVIDPKGFIGDPAYEVAAFIRNPIPELLADKNAMPIIQYRTQRFSQILGFSERRITDWCFVQAVLGWIWALEDKSDNIGYFSALTELLDKITDN